MYGLLGEHLPHSFSPQIHMCLGNEDYHLFETAPENLEKFLTSGKFKGINVTIPYKKAVIPFLDEISAEARKIGAAFTSLSFSATRLALTMSRLLSRTP